MVGGGADDAVTVWDAISWSIHLKLKGHSGPVTSVCMDGGSRIVSGSEDKSIRVWDIVTEKEVLKLEGHSDAVTAVAVSPDGKYVVSGSRDMTMRLWDVAGGKEILKLGDYTSAISSVSISPDCKRIVSGSRDVVRVWDVAGGLGQASSELHEVLNSAGHTQPVPCVCLSEDGSHVVSGSLDGTVRLWDTQTKHEYRRVEKHEGVVRSVCTWTPEGGERLVAIGGDDSTVRIWSEGSEDPVCELRCHDNDFAIMSMCVTPDRRRIVAGGWRNDCARVGYRFQAKDAVAQGSYRCGHLHVHVPRW